MGFTFAEKHMIEICGKRYPCDIGDCRMLEGVARDFPRILGAAQELLQIDAQLKATVRDKAPARELGEELIERNNALLAACKTFVEGTLGEAEYREIFAGRPANTEEHIELCAYIYSDIMGGRREIVNEYLDPAVREEGQTTNGAEPDAGSPPGDIGTGGGDGLAVVDAPRGLCARLLTALGRKG